MSAGIGPAMRSPTITRRPSFSVPRGDWRSNTMACAPEIGARAHLL
jgi:hypothetical protein